MSVTISLTDKQAEWLDRETRNDQDPEAVEIHGKLMRRRSDLPAVIPGQVSLEDYPEVFSDAA